MNKFVLTIIGGILLCACTPKGDYKAESNNPEYLHRSIKHITDVIVHDIFSPPVASRIYAYVSVAGYEAARYQDSTFLSPVGMLNGLTTFPKPTPDQEYVFPLAATEAVLLTGRSFVFSEDKLDEFHDAILKEYRQMGIPDDVFERSLAFGKAISEHVVQWSSKDNYKQTRSFPKYSIDDSPSTWKPTPPAYMDAVEPHWNKIRPFAIDSASQFRCPPPPLFSTDKNSDFYKLAREVYDVGKGLDKEQRDIASFWDCNPFVMNVKGHVMFATKKISPGGHWMNITHTACSQANLNAARSSAAYLRVSVAIADAFIACWEEKYRSLLIRPETFINIYIDENWIPLLQTPPFPEYISGHSTISGAAAGALTKTFGDGFAFVDSTEVEFGLSIRKFESFNDAASEAAVSRLYGGIHYRPANEIGLKMGKEIGAFLNRKLLLNEADKTTAKLEL